MPKQSIKTTKSATKQAKSKKMPETSIETNAETKKQKKKTGSPSQYANKVKPYLDKIAQYIRCGVTEGQICEFYGVGKTQWAQYKKDNPELTAILCKAKTELKTNLVNKAYEVAVGYVYEETTTVEYKDKEGKVTGYKTTTHKKYAKADAGMLEFLLINRFSDEFARDPQILELRKEALRLQAEGKIPPNAEGI